jgi:CO/xanthine dehydrogenase FAD-binding subunit
VNASDAATYRPRTIEELDRIVMRTSEPITYIAGTTDLMVRPDRWHAAKCLVDLTSVEDLASVISPEDAGLLIGAALPLSRLIEESFVQKHFSLLSEACGLVGSVQIRNRATLGGNIANASPAGDSLPVLNVYDAALWLGPRENGHYERVPISDIILGPGSTRLQNRYIAYIHLPLPKGKGQFGYFRKVGQRYSMAISKLSLAVLGWHVQGRLLDIRICAGSVSPVVRRATETEAMLRGQILTEECIQRAAFRLAEEVAPITDIRSSESYRRKICGAALQDALSKVGMSGEKTS